MNPHGQSPFIAAQLEDKSCTLSPTSSDLMESHLDNNTSSDEDLHRSQGISSTSPGNFQNQVSTVILLGIPIVSLHMDGLERLCLAQISNTLLKEFSYNEIHNRRVALGITCIQCTPVQLEILRRAGAMPISSRRCGMITKREAERLVKSFVGDAEPPKLPDNFSFQVKHECGWGCKGQFVPSRYNSSRAKCIKCVYCSVFFSPNKFIFHFHRGSDSKYRHPDAANFNSWRRHLLLDYPFDNTELIHAWEDVKAMFNGGSRKRALPIKTEMKSNGNDPDMIPLSTSPIHEKRSKFSLPSNLPSPPLNTFPFQHNAAVHAGNPMLHLQTQNQCNSLQGFIPRPPLSHHPFPFMNPPMETILAAGRKIPPHFNDFWKNKPNYMYNPFNFLWAKKMGLYPEHQSNSAVHNAINHPSIEYPNQSKNDIVNNPNGKGKDPLDSNSLWNNQMLNAEILNQKALAATNAHYSAFKPVSRMAIDSFNSVHSDKPDMWSPAKEIASPPRTPSGSSSPIMGSDEATNDACAINRRLSCEEDLFKINDNQPTEDDQINVTDLGDADEDTEKVVIDCGTDKRSEGTPSPNRDTCRPEASEDKEQETRHTPLGVKPEMKELSTREDWLPGNRNESHYEDKLNQNISQWDIKSKDEMEKQLADLLREQKHVAYQYEQIHANIKHESSKDKSKYENTKDRNDIEESLREDTSNLDSNGTIGYPKFEEKIQQMHQALSDFSSKMLALQHQIDSHPIPT